MGHPVDFGLCALKLELYYPEMTKNRRVADLKFVSQVLDVVLHKGSSGLGFSLAGGADTVGGCFVREIIGDPAKSDGRLRPKDQIVMVSVASCTTR